MAVTRTCALGVALLLVSTVYADTNQWGRQKQEARSSSDWIPVSAPFRDSDTSASAQHEEVATVLRPPDFGVVRQQRLIQSPRQGRNPQGTGQQYFPGDQSHIIRFPGDHAPQQRAPQFPQNFQNPQFLPPQPIPAGFPPSALTQHSFQPQPIPAFNNHQQQKQAFSNQQQSSQAFSKPGPARLHNNSFVPAGPQDEVQLVYVPVEALQGQKGNVNKQKPQSGNQFNNPGSRDEAFQTQLRQFVQQQPQVNPQQQYLQEQERIAQIREQEERHRIQEKERKERIEQEERLRREQEIKEREEQEQKLRKEQELREQEVFRKIKADKDAKHQEDRAKHEANLKLQQQQRQEFQYRPQEQFASTAPSLQAQENAFQQQLQQQPPTASSEPAGPAPHQPPLAVYMSSSSSDPAIIEDVLFALRDAVTIPVLDRVPSPKSTPPQVFVGPAEMKAPEGYTKFELPYLSTLESNRVERKVEQLPFFVAPLSFQPPNGYSKIPFPAPHVGSVVVSHGQSHDGRTVNPNTQVLPEEYETSELPSISPAIPLLVNSLQNGRGAKHQRPHVQQQFVQQQQQFPHNQQQFLPHHQQQFIPHEQQQFVSQDHQQFLPQQQQEFVPQQQQEVVSQQQQEFIPQQQQEFVPQYEEEQIVATDAPEPPPTLAAPTFSRRPLNSRGRTRQQQADVAVTTPIPRRSTAVRDTPAPVTHTPRGRRPGGRHRATTQQPIAEESFESTLEVSQDQQKQPELQNASPTPPQFEQKQFTEPQFNHQSFDPQAFPTYQGQFQQPQEQGFHALPVQPAVKKNFDGPSNHATHSRGQFAAPTPTAAYQAEQQIVLEQAEIDSSNYDNQRFEAPKKVATTRIHETPRLRPKHPESSTSVSTEEPTFQRSRPTVFQPVVSSTPETLFSRHSVSPFVSSTAYPTEALAITPHHVSKGEVGKVQQHVSFPFIPTPLPTEYPAINEDTYVSSTPASPAPEPHVFSIDTTPEAITIAPTEEPLRTASPSPVTLSYQTPSRPRGRVTQQNLEQVDANEPTRITPRPRVRAHTESPTEATPSYQSSQRFRGRGQTSREESTDETTSHQPAQRVRTRVHTGRGRGAYTTESSAPGLQITVADLPGKQSEDTQTETPSSRTRPRFRVGERARAPGARQQQITRGRQTIRQQESDNLELAKPVRQQFGSAAKALAVDSPVYVPDVQFESGFVPAIDSQKALPTSTEAATDVTTVKPGRGRFNNFGTGVRGTRRQQSRTTVNQEIATAAPIVSGRGYTVRGSRRQQTTTAQPGARVTSVRGNRVRHPNAATTTTEVPEEEELEEVNVAPVSTGVTYVKNPYVNIERPGNDAPSTANEVQGDEIIEEVSRTQAPVQIRHRQKIPQVVDEESYVDAPASRYDVSPKEPEYQQYFTPFPSAGPSRAVQRQEQYFTASSPQPPQQLIATPQPQQQQFHREEPQQYHREEFEYQPQQAVRQHRPRPHNAGRHETIDDPEYGGEESQRSEQISIQQLEGALAASLFNKALDTVELVDEYEGPENVELSDESERGEQSISEEREPQTEQEHEEEEERSTEENVTEQETTEQSMTTTSDEEVSQSAPVSVEPEPVSDDEKLLLHAKPSEGKRRRVRVRTRKQQQRPADEFETAESQNVASVATNLLNQQSILHDKQANLNNNDNNNWKLSIPNYPTIDLTSEDIVDDDNYNNNSEVDNIHFTTSEMPDYTEETKVPEIITEETVVIPTTVTPIVETTSEQADVITTSTTTTTEAPVTTVTEPMTVAETDELPITSTPAETTTEFAGITDTAPPSTPRVLGTSTTTEISLETEICYRGRCVKTKVDADQMPIE